MEINVKKIAEAAKIKYPDLLTRVTGRSLYDRLVKKMEFVGHDEVVILDFSGIKVMDSSFIDEFIVKFLIEAGSGERKYYGKLREISEIGQNNVESVFQSYLQFNKQRLVAVTEDLSINNKFFLGTLSALEEDIFNYIRINKLVFIEDIASALNYSSKMVDDILAEMIKLRITRQNDDGKFLPV